MESEMKKQICIGHPGYAGANAVAICHSKAAAIRELRNRGVKRDPARDAVNDVCLRAAGYTTVRPDILNIIEVTNMDAA